jgi:hypothetical protein
MGPELRTGLTSAHLVQLAFPALQDLPLLAPPPERSFTELIVAPEVALTKLPATNGAPAAKADPAPVLSPSQVRCFFDCPARWWFKYGLQLPERKNSSLALGLAVHQALEVNFRESRVRVLPPTWPAVCPICLSSAADRLTARASPKAPARPLLGFFAPYV